MTHHRPPAAAGPAADTARPGTRPRGAWPLAAALLLAGACIGTVADPEGARPGGGVDRPAPPQPPKPGRDTPAPPQPAPASGARLARLSHAQWENAVRDLLRLDAPPGLSAAFIRDPIAGFDNAGDQLSVSAELRGDYERAAEALAAQVAGRPAQLAKLVPADAPADPMGRGAALVRELGRRAYRRPLERDEEAELLRLYAQGPALTGVADPFAAGAELVLRALLQSPFFLYRTELGVKGEGGRIALAPYEVAAKLAFSLTNTMPDEALFAAAAEGRLATREGRLAEARRLLEGARGTALIDSFTLQALELPRYDAIGTKDKALFGPFEASLPKLPADAREETLRFSREIFSKDLGLGALLTAPFTFVNARLAAIYGLSGSFTADAFTRVELDAGTRAGILTQIGFLASKAGATQPDPIHRGLFVIEKLVCDHVPPPVANVTAPKVEGGKTNRQLWEAHTGSGVCAGCHAQIINPVGFAFEGLDALGRVRTHDSGLPVDATGFYRFAGSGERRFDGPVALARALAEAPEVAACHARRWLSYLAGRTLTEGDEPEVAALGAWLRAPKASIKGLVLEIVSRDAFVTRAP